MGMATRVIIPKQGLQMTHGTITAWFCQEGDRVEIGQPLFEMETDKVAITVDSPANGVLLKILRQQGDEVPVSETIGIIGKAGENIAELLSVEQQQTTETDKSAVKYYATPRAKWLAAERNVSLENIVPSGPAGLIVARDIENAAVMRPGKITPIEKKMVDVNNIELTNLKGIGASGKITTSDVERFMPADTNKTVSPVQRDRIMPFSAMRKVIAERMMQSLHTMAQANHRIKVNMSKLIMLRNELATAGTTVTYTDILAKIVTHTLADYPMLNSSWSEQGIILKNYVNMGIAVAVESGLIVPVIHNAQTMNLPEFSAKTKELIAKAQNGALSPDEYSGGTFTLTNLGMFDVDEFTAIINPPESAILALGKIDRVPVVEEETVVIRPIMVLSLSYDHRLIDGALAAQFLQRVKHVINNPFLLL
jgi:pyruvate dehydrogenase E2 component (dihydrolipoamide acetyltransferase)